MATRVKAKLVPSRKLMSKARRAHLSKLAKERWAAKRAAAATVAVTQPIAPSADSIDFNLGFIKGIMYTMGALEA